MSEAECRRGTCERDRFRDGQCEMHYYKEKHCQRVLEEYPESLNYIVCELVEKNCEKFLTGHRKRTHGAEQVRQDGLTENHRRWIATILEEEMGVDRAIHYLESDEFDLKPPLRTLLDWKNDLDEDFEEVADYFYVSHLPKETVEITDDKFYVTCELTWWERVKAFLFGSYRMDVSVYLDIGTIFGVNWQHHDIISRLRKLDKEDDSSG